MEEEKELNVMTVKILMLFPISKMLVTSQSILKVKEGVGERTVDSAFDYTEKSLIASKGPP